MDTLKRINSFFLFYFILKITNFFSHFCSLHTNYLSFSNYKAFNKKFLSTNQMTLLRLGCLRLVWLESMSSNVATSSAYLLASTVSLRPTAAVCRCQCRFISDAPLTIRPSNMQPRKVYKDKAVEEKVHKLEMMDPVDIHELPRAHQGMAMEIDWVNKKRVEFNVRLLYKGIAGALCLCGLILAIYWYTVITLGQESLLEEIDEEVGLERGELELDEEGQVRPAESIIRKS